MKKFISYKYWDKYIALGFICDLCVPYVFKSVLLLIRKVPLSVWGNVIIDICFLIIAIMFGGLAILSFLDKKNDNNNNRKKHLEVLIVEGILLIGFSNLGAYGIKCIAGLINIYPMFGYIIMLGIVIIIGVYICFLLNCIYKFVVHLQGFYDVKATKVIMRYMRKSKTFVLKSVVLVVIILFGRNVLEGLISIISISKTGSFITNASYYMLEALLLGRLLYWYITNMDKFFEEYIFSGDFEIGTVCTISKKRKILTMLVFVLGILIFLIPNIDSFAGSSPKKQVEELVEKGKKFAELEDIEHALKYYQEADRYIQALQAYLEENEDLLKCYAKDYVDTPFYRDLYLTLVPDTSFVENLILHGEAKKEDIFYLLDLYNKQENLSEEELIFQKECIDVCIAQNYLYGNNERFREKDLRQSKIDSIVQEYEERLSQTDVLELMITAKQCGIVTDELLNEANELADHNPENFMCQFAALAIAEEYIRQGGTDYSNVMKIINRYNEGIIDRYSESVQVAQEKTYVARLLIDIGKINEGCEVLEEAYSYEPLEETADYLLFCYNTQDDGEKILALVRDLENRGIVSRETLFYGAVGNLYIGDVMNSLQYGTKLTERVTDKTNTEKEKDMEYLNGYLGYLLIDNEYVRDIWGEAVVEELSEEEWNYVRTCPFLEASILAVDSIYNSGDYYKALTQLEIMDGEVPELSKVKYYQGAVYCALEEYEKAIENLKQCLQIDATNLQAAYTLAKCYENMGQYDMALNQCESILQQLSQKQEVIDSYGIYEETEIMYENLKQKAGCTNG